jgi:hypothetical protein
MPMGSVQLRPGVNVERTLSANEAGVSQAQLIRYKDQMVQTYGGWTQYVPTLIPSTVRALHAWQDAAGIQHLGVGATANLIVITAGANSDVTPQTATVDSSATFTTTLNSQTVSITVPNSSGYPSTYNSVFFNTPVSIAGQIISGGYDIVSVLSTISFTINITNPATAAASSSGVLPTFLSTVNSAVVYVNFPDNNYQQITGLFYPFYAATELTSNLTIQGPYQVASIIDSTQFTINAAVESSATVTATMNASLVETVFYIAIGPAATGTGYGSGGYGSGGYGGVTSGTAPVTGTTIMATDWTMDNWGQVLLACPEDGPVYAWAPDSGLQTAQVVNQAPFFNGGIFVSMPSQILVAWRSCQIDPAGGWLSQNNLQINWSDAEDYTNWTQDSTTAAGSFVLPTGSIIMGGLQSATQGIIWTDVDVWNMQYVGDPLIFNFNRLGSGCGLIGKHAAGVLGGNVYWCGFTNFFSLSSNGVTPINCSVWDYIFQNLNTTYEEKIVCATNTAFNEVMWLFPSAASIGENDSYVKYNVLESAWDYGTMSRTAWIDVSVLGSPIAADHDGSIYQHEMGTTLSGESSPSFRTGWWSIADGNELSFVDWVLPDFIWGTYSGTKDAQVTMTFYTADYPGDTPRTYGPYTVTSATEYINLRARGRLMSVQITSGNPQFFRLGRIRFRFASSGRR